MTDFTCSNCGGRDVAVQRYHQRKVTFWREETQGINHTMRLHTDGSWIVEDTDMLRREELDSGVDVDYVIPDTIVWFVHCSGCGRPTDFKWSHGGRLELTARSALVRAKKLRHAVMSADRIRALGGFLVEDWELEPEQCDHTLTRTRQWLEENNGNSDELEFLKSEGGECDCEVMFNVYCHMYYAVDDEEDTP